MRMEIGYYGASVGTKLGLESVRIGFEREKISLRAEDFVFVNGAFADFGKEKLPDAGGSAGTHGMDATVPAIHVANNADATCGRSPHSEMRSRYVCDGVEMGAELFVGVEMAAFANEVEVEIGEEGWKSVRVGNFGRL